MQNAKFRQVGRETETLSPHRWECEMMPPLRKSVFHHLLNLVHHPVTLQLHPQASLPTEIHVYLDTGPSVPHSLQEHQTGNSPVLIRSQGVKHCGAFTQRGWMIHRHNYNGWIPWVDVILSTRSHTPEYVLYDSTYIMYKTRQTNRWCWKSRLLPPRRRGVAGGRCKGRTFGFC